MLFRTDTDDVMERCAKRALTDSGDAAQFGDGDRLPQVAAEELVDAGDDFGARHMMDNWHARHRTIPSRHVGTR